LEPVGDDPAAFGAPTDKVKTKVVPRPSSLDRIAAVRLDNHFSDYQAQPGALFPGLSARRLPIFLKQARDLLFGDAPTPVS
jgi:hypothetical protein